jgi:hypothetical protein
MMELSVKLAGDAVKFLGDVSKATDKAAIRAANTTAYIARTDMKKSALATQGEGIGGITITYATPKQPYAQILSSNWDQMNPGSMALTVDGGAGYKKAFLSAEMPAGDMVMMAGRFVGHAKRDKKGGGKAAFSSARADVAVAAGFVGIMKGVNAKSKNKIGLFMRIGAERKIRILYSFKTLKQANALQALGMDVAAKNFSKQFDEKLTSLLSKLSGSQWGK